MALQIAPPESEIFHVNKDLPTEHEMMVYHTMAKQAVESKMYKGIGEQSGVMMIMLAARELGIPPMQALNGGINIIQGKAEISARMMGAMIRKAGHQFSIKEISENLCTLVGRRGDTGEVQTATFTTAEAQRAGLIKPGSGWIKWPKDMCYARALSRLARQLFQDVIGIGYVEGEIVASDAQVVLPEPIPEIVEDIDDEKNMEMILEWAGKENACELNEYIEVVMNHFGWTKSKTIKEFAKDEASFKKKFNNWKSKILQEKECLSSKTS